MCGRYSFFSKSQIIAKRFKVEVKGEIKPHYNASPGQILPIITSENKTELTFGYWGLKPKWLKKSQAGLINARAESVTQKPSFKNALAKRRCLILADGFFEWQKSNGHKIPYRFLLKTEEPFALAGIYEPFKVSEEKIIPSYAILTTVANKTVSLVHQRMPIILKPENEKYWLAENISSVDRADILAPLEANKMKAYRISTLVNKPQIDRPEILDPVDEENKKQTHLI